MKRIFISLAEAVAVVAIIKVLPLNNIDNYIEWVGKAIVTFVISSVVVFSGGYVFFKKDLLATVKKLCGIVKH